MKESKLSFGLKVFLGMLLLLVCLAPAVAKSYAAGDDGSEKPTPTPIEDYVHKEQYLEGYYRGYVNKDTSTVRPGPGSKAYEPLKLDDGTTVTLNKGAEVFVYGETKDVDLDVWYHIKTNFKGQEVEGYLYSGRVDRENTQIRFTPTPTPEPTFTPVPVITEEIVDPALNPTPTTVLPPNIEEIKKKDGDKHKWILPLVLCLIVITGIIIYTVFQRIQEKRIEEEMERYSKRRPAMERIDGEDEEDFRQAKKQYYANEFGHEKAQEKADIDEDFDIKPDLTGVFDDDIDETALAIGTPKNANTQNDIYEKVEMSDEDVKIVNDFRTNAKPASAENAKKDEYSDDDLAYFERLKGKADLPSSSAIAAAGSAASILEESPAVSGLFEADEPSVEEILREKLDELRPQDHFVHKLYGEGEVIDNSDSDVIQVRFGRDLRFLKKDKLARKELVKL